MPDFYIILAYILAYIGLIATSFYIINIFLYYKRKIIPKPTDKKKVSIIIPAYNEEKSIAKTIESALSLEYNKENLEIIVIDDGSRDNTYEIARKFESSNNPKIFVFTRKNGGKGSALNFGIERASGEIIVTMDADTFVNPNALKIMMGYFENKEVACVAPSMAIYSPKSMLQRIQQIEYYMGVFLRKSFASMNAIHITPGAFSAYRKSFFEDYGGFDENNLTEDLELALRIQSKQKVIENAPDAVAYTVAPAKFKELMFQRRRWYAGLIKNLWIYRKLFGIKKGPLGAVVLPVAVSTIALSVTLTSYVLIKTILRVKREILDLNSINFQFNNLIELNKFTLERLFFTLFGSKIFILSVLFLTLLWFYMIFSKRAIKYKEGIKINFLLFSVFYSILFAFWWVVSGIYVLFNKQILWRSENAKK